MNSFIDGYLNAMDKPYWQRTAGDEWFLGMANLGALVGGLMLALLLFALIAIIRDLPNHARRFKQNWEYRKWQRENKKQKDA